MNNTEILNKLVDLILVEDLMTKDVKFYEDLEDPVKFCIERDIDRLPISNSKNYKLFNKADKNFNEKSLLFEEIIESPSLNIKEFIERTKNHDIFFVFERDKLVGVIHYCDIIDSLVYVYFYAIFNIFESKLRLLLREKGYDNYKLLEWLKNKNTDKEKITNYENDISRIILPRLQHFEFSQLLKFANVNKIVSIDEDTLSSIIILRNFIMHHKDISSRQDRQDISNEMLYKREDYNKFLKAYSWLIEAIK